MRKGNIRIQIGSILIILLVVFAVPMVADRISNRGAGRNVGIEQRKIPVASTPIYRPKQSIAS